jgi:hypothetical protein
MTKIAIITGTNRARPTAKDLVSEAKQRAALVAPLPFFDTAALSEGEMLVMLQAAKDRIMMQYFPEVPQYRAAYEKKVDALAKGLHRGTGLLSFGERSMTKPAGGWLSWAQKGFSPNEGLKNLFNDAPEGVAVRGIGEVPQLSCNSLYPVLPRMAWEGQGSPMGNYDVYVAQQNAKRTACTEENIWRGVFNENLAKSAQHPIYEFQSGATTPTVYSKKVSHQIAVDELAKQSKIARAIIREWMHTGAIHQNSTLNIQGGTPYPATPEEAIEALKRKAVSEGIGVIAWTAPLIIQLIGAIAAAITAAGILVASIQNKRPNAAEQFKAVTNGWSNPSYTGQYTDFENGGGGGGNNGGGSNGGGNTDLLSNANLPLLGLAAGGLVLALSGKK